MNNEINDIVSKETVQPNQWGRETQKMVLHEVGCKGQRINFTNVTRSHFHSKARQLSIQL